MPCLQCLSENPPSFPRHLDDLAPHRVICHLTHSFAVANVLTSPDTPRFLRLPGLICLFRAWLLFTILLLQVSNLWPVDPESAFFNGNRLGRVVVSFGEWAGGMEMQKACWQVFLSVCCGLVCSGLANGLDRG
jgi:hypothetical protein